MVTAQRPYRVKGHRANIDCVELREGRLGCEERGVQRGTRKRSRQRERYPLGASALGQVVMNE